MAPSGARCGDVLVFDLQFHGQPHRRAAGRYSQETTVRSNRRVSRSCGCRSPCWSHVDLAKSCRHDSRRMAIWAGRMHRDGNPVGVGVVRQVVGNRSCLAGQIFYHHIHLLLLQIQQTIDDYFDHSGMGAARTLEGCPRNTHVW